MVKILTSRFAKANIKEYSGRPLRRGTSFACDQCKDTSLSGIYGPVDGKDVYLCADCFKSVLNRRKKAFKKCPQLGLESTTRGRGMAKVPRRPRTRS